MNPSKDIFKRAEQAAKKQNFEYAIELYLQGLSINPKTGAERRVMHKIMREVVVNAGGNPAGGLKTKLQVAGAKAKVKKLKVQKKWEEAIREQEKVLRPQPENPAELYELAELLVHCECIDAAIVMHEDVVDIEHGHTESYRRLGQLWEQKGEPKKAIEAWEKVRLYKPDDKEASKSIRDLSASTLVDAVEERKRQAGDESYRAMLKDEEESEDLEKKNKVIRTDEDRIEAIGFKKEDLKADPKNSRLWRELGGLYQDLRKWKHAMAAYKKAIEVNPHDLFAPDKIGQLKEAVHEENVRALKKKLDGMGKDGGEAEAAALQAQLKDAESKLLTFKIAEYERRTKAHPTDYALKLSYGELLMEGARHDEAIGQFQEAVKDPKYRVAAQNQMGQCFQAKGVYAIAIKSFEDALDNCPDRDNEVGKDIRYHLGVVYEEMGDVKQALKIYEEIMATDINYRDVSARVDRLLGGGGAA